MLTLSLHIVDHHGLHVVQDLGIHSDGGAGLDAADTDCLCLLLDPGDLGTRLSRNKVIFQGSRLGFRS